VLNYLEVAGRGNSTCQQRKESYGWMIDEVL